MYVGPNVRFFNSTVLIRRLHVNFCTQVVYFSILSDKLKCIMVASTIHISYINVYVHTSLGQAAVSCSHKEPRSSPPCRRWPAARIGSVATDKQAADLSVRKSAPIMNI